MSRFFCFFYAVVSYGLNWVFAPLKRLAGEIVLEMTHNIWSGMWIYHTTSIKFISVTALVVVLCIYAFLSYDFSNISESNVYRCFVVLSSVLCWTISLHMQVANTGTAWINKFLFHHLLSRRHSAASGASLSLWSRSCLVLSISHSLFFFFYLLLMRVILSVIPFLLQVFYVLMVQHACRYWDTDISKKLI